MSNQPSLAKIIRVDYYAFTALIAPLVLWGIILVGLAFQQQYLLQYTALFVALTVLFALGLLARVRLFFTVFGQGHEAPATVQQVTFFRSRYSSGQGSITYAYKFREQDYACTSQLLKTSRTEALKIGDRITVLIDRNKPGRAFIRDLYI